MSNVSYGMKTNSLLIGAVAVDGGAGTVLTSPGKVLEDTVELTPSDSTKTAFTAQGDSDPFVLSVKKGIREGQFDLGTLDPEVIADLAGGTVTGSGANKVYNAPTGNPAPIYKTLKIIDEQNVAWLFPRVLIDADIIGRWRNGELNVLRVKFTVMQPTKTGIAPLMYGNPAVEG
ncbi:hypothetical protein [Sphingobacterium cavernae]|uniref:hypothetical protein n=1 Tax=Sphingobacterium cavernae TaxID=2592657 RepID=UPI00122FFF82|nr:hypothetical protein [Sphingobacterium cavernae]